MLILDQLDALPPLISVEKAAELLGLSRASAYRYAKAGHLPARYFGNRVFIVTDRLREIFAEPSTDRRAA